jgi:hypothetical protein
MNLTNYDWIVVNTSAGKDSQAMLSQKLLRQIRQNRSWQSRLRCPKIAGHQLHLAPVLFHKYTQAAGVLG